jgi:microcystin degradation protein MlrC
MAVAIASMLQESNTFSPVMTRYEDFAPVFGPAVLDRHQGKMTEMGGFIEALTKARKPIAPVCAAWAITANRLVRADFERLMEEFVSHLEGVGKVEGLLLAMHGAQTAEGEDDVEGFVLGRAREVLGPDVPIVLTLDLHANITKAMVERSTAIVGYHTYPHIDMFETGRKAASLLLATLSGKIYPTMSWRKMPLIVNAENQQTSHGPAQRLFARAQAFERAGKAEAVSIFPVQPWMDIREMGAAVVSVTNGDARAADRQAATIGQKFWDTREDFAAMLTPVEEAIKLAMRQKAGLS